MDTLCSIEIGHNRQREPYEKILQIPTMDVGGGESKDKYLGQIIDIGEAPMGRAKQRYYGSKG